jgi:tetratricopeptide (TPR) repeat protein
MKTIINKKQAFIILIVLCLTAVSFSQTKVQKLYDEKKYEKCIQLSDKNINENIDKQVSILYKSLALTDGANASVVFTNYPEPYDEAIQGIQKLQSLHEKNPKDKFLILQKQKINQLVQKIEIQSEILYSNGNKKESLKLYKKLIECYPEENSYIFKIAKTLDFDYKNVIAVLKITDENYYNKMYDVVKNAPKHFAKNGKTELENAAEVLYLSQTEDLETISMILVFLQENYPTSQKISGLYKNFSMRYWQIEMIQTVNKLRAKGCICGTTQMAKTTPIILDNCLCRTAQKYSELMNKENHFSHTGPDGKSPWKRAGEEGCSADGENIALGSSSVESVINLWTGSPGHCKNMMGNHTHAGFGDSGVYWVQMFR